MTRRGFSIIEIVLAFALLGMGVYSIRVVLLGNSRQASHSRNAGMAMILAQNMLAELQAHPYGEPAPAHWPLQEQQVDIPFIVEGNVLSMTFKVHLEFENQTFLQPSTQSLDRATYTITWSESIQGQTKTEKAEFKTHLYRGVGGG